MKTEQQEQTTDWMTCSFTGFEAWNKANDINAPEIEIRKLFNQLQGLSDMEHNEVLNSFIRKYQNKPTKKNAEPGMILDYIHDGFRYLTCDKGDHGAFLFVDNEFLTIYAKKDTTIFYHLGKEIEVNGKLLRYSAYIPFLKLKCFFMKVFNK